MTKARILDWGTAALGLFLIWLIPAADIIAVEFGLLRAYFYEHTIFAAFALPALQLAALMLAYVFGTASRTVTLAATFSLVPIAALLAVVLYNYMP
jgi:hypothetical protein